MMLPKKRILLLTDWYYPGYRAGGPIQSCRNLVAALKNDLSFYIFTSNSDFGELTAYRDVQFNSWNTGPSGEKIYYSDSTRIFSEMKTILREVKPDVVYFNSIFSYQYTILPFIVLRLTGFKGKVVLAPRGMLHQGALFFKSSKKSLFLYLLRFSGLYKRLRFQATDDREMIDIQKIFPKAETFFAANIPKTDIEIFRNKIKEKGKLRMIFFSRIHPKKNLDYILNVLAEKKITGEIIFDIFGTPESQEYLEKCREIAKGISANTRVNFYDGATNDEILRKMQNYEVFVLPTRGENFGHAIFESLMSGLPVLISDQTPWKGLEEQFAGWEIPLQNTGAFADAIQRLINMDNTEYGKWSEGARRLALNYLKHTDFKNNYLSLFNEN